MRAAALLLLLVALSGGHRAGSGAVTVLLPSGWHAFQPFEGVPATVADPVTRLAVASSPIRLDARSSCQVAAYAFGSNAATIATARRVLDSLRVARR